MVFTAEIFDQLQQLYDKNGCNDHQIHCKLEFERPLDTEILAKAVLASIEFNSNSWRTLRRRRQSVLDQS